MIRGIVNYNLREFFQHFASRGFELLVLRGYERLPADYGGDLDLEVPGSQYGDFVRELLRFCSLQSLRLFRYVYRPHVSSFKFYRVRDSVIERLIIDVTCRGGSWFGFSYLTNEELFAKSEKVGLWRIPYVLHELVLKAFTSMLIGSYVPERYFDEFATRLPYIRDEFVEFVQDRFPGIEAERLYNALVNGDQVCLKAFLPKLKWTLVKRGLKSSPLETLKVMIQTFGAEIYYYAQKNGLKIYVLCNCKELSKWSDWERLLGKQCGHVWKKIIIWEEPANIFVRIVDGVVQQFELFRDRLIVVPTLQVEDKGIFVCPNCIHNSEFQKETSGIPITDAEAVLALYRLLEKRNKERSKKWVFTNLLWRSYKYSNVLQVNNWTLD